jgi:hypothetical protein
MGASDGPKGGLQRHMSDAALQTFCHLHHLLLAAALQPGSQLVQSACRDVRAFVASPAARHKSSCPDLGLLMVQLLLVPKTSVPWAAFAPALLQELLARQVLWATRGRDGLAFGSPQHERPSVPGRSADDEWRMKAHWASGAVGCKMVMLQAWFANALARPASTAGCLRELGAIKAGYDACSGMPPLATFRAFNRQARLVLACGGWEGFLRCLRLRVRPGLVAPAAIAAMLRQAVVDSWAARYHSRPALAGPSATQLYLHWHKEEPVRVQPEEQWL